MSFKAACATALAVALGGAAFASEAEIVSTVIAIDRDDCVKVGADGDWGSYADWGVERCAIGHGIDLVYSSGHAIPSVRLDPWLSRGFYERDSAAPARFTPFLECQLGHARERREGARRVAGRP